jgi:hypothetical protein
VRSQHQHPVAARLQGGHLSCLDKRQRIQQNGRALYFIVQQPRLGPGLPGTT